jgi:hypothetical protein
MSPRTLDKWELDHKELVYIEQVGAGAFGTVWRVLPSTSPLDSLSPHSSAAPEPRRLTVGDASF